MADEVDRMKEREQAIESLRVAEIRAKAASMPKGKPGTCAHCGEESKRLVHYACARCRDELGLP